VQVHVFRYQQPAVHGARHTWQEEQLVKGTAAENNSRNQWRAIVGPAMVLNFRETAHAAAASCIHISNKGTGNKTCLCVHTFSNFYPFLACVVCACMCAVYRLMQTDEKGD
jgi:hypothetical protein